MTNTRGRDIIFNHLSAGFTYQITNAFSYSSSLFLDKLSVLGIKFGIGYHSFKLVVPVNIGVLKVCGEVGVAVTFGLVGASLLLLKAAWNETHGEILRKDEIEAECDELTEYQFVFLPSYVFHHENTYTRYRNGEILLTAPEVQELLVNIEESNQEYQLRLRNKIRENESLYQLLRGLFGRDG